MQEENLSDKFNEFKEVKRLFDVPYAQLAMYPLSKSLCTKKNGNWYSLSTRFFICECSKLSRGLLHLGVSKETKIAIISDRNCYQWHVCDIGIMQTGAKVVPVYPDISQKDYEYVFNHAEIEYCFVSNKELYDKIAKIKDKLTHLKEIYSFKEINGYKYWGEILDLGRKTINQKKLDTIKSEIDENDVSSIIYTSGTTGVPKGVVLTHKNIVSNILGCSKRLNLNQGSVALSFLPTCHIYERMMIYMYMYRGISIYFAESINKIGENIREVKPHIMTVVPRVIDKLYGKIISKGKELHGIKKSLFFWAIKLGKSYSLSKKSYCYKIKLWIARKLIFSKWKKALGGEIKIIVSGGASLQTELAKVFNASGITLIQGYGMTEMSPVITVESCHITEGRKIGTVGKPLEGVEVKIAEDGEILCKGPNIMKEYYKDKTMTENTIIDGYVHTGDIGSLDEDGYLRITDRKKEIFKTSGGKYIAPQHIENILRSSPFIDQIIVLGENKKTPCAIICPDFSLLENWGVKQGIAFKSKEELVKNPKVLDRINKEIGKYNELLPKWEQVKRFLVINNTWEIGGPFLTPTFKLRRKKILEHYDSLIESLYKN